MYNNQLIRWIVSIIIMIAFSSTGYTMYFPETYTCETYDTAKVIAERYIDQPEFLAFAHETGHLIISENDDQSYYIGYHFFTPYAFTLAELHKELKLQQTPPTSSTSRPAIDIIVSQPKKEELIVFLVIISKVPIEALDSQFHLYIPIVEKTIEPIKTVQSYDLMAPIEEMEAGYAFGAVFEYVFLFDDFPRLDSIEKADYNVVAIFASQKESGIYKETVIDLSSFY